MTEYWLEGHIIVLTGHQTSAAAMLPEIRMSYLEQDLLLDHVCPLSILFFARIFLMVQCTHCSMYILISGLVIPVDALQEDWALHSMTVTSAYELVEV